MQLKDKINFYGVFKIVSYDINDNIIDTYEDKNLIMDTARANMAQLIGGVNVGAGDLPGQHIDKFVLGTLGHVGADILDYKVVGENGFDSTRTALFSEESAVDQNYRITFDAQGDDDVTVGGDGVMYDGSTLKYSDVVGANTVRRTVAGTAGRTVAYEITVPITCGNSGEANPVVAYTEAALYTGGEIFSMKCFPARVKEDTVKLTIKWSILF